MAYGGEPIYEEYGLDEEGNLHIFNEEGYDEEGYDKNGFNVEGKDRGGFSFDDRPIYEEIERMEKENKIKIEKNKRIEQLRLRKTGAGEKNDGGEINRLNDEILRLKDFINEKKEEIEKWGELKQIEIEDLKKKGKITEKENEEIKKIGKITMDEWRNEYNQFKNFIKLKERELLELKKKSDQIEYLKKEQDEKIKYLEKEKERLEKEIERVEKEKERVEKEKILFIKKKKDEITSLIENVNKLEVKQKGDIRKIDGLKKENSSLQSQIDELKQEKKKMVGGYIKELRKKLKEYEENEKKINELEDQIHTTNEEADAALAQLNELKAKLETLRNNVTKMQTDFDIEIAGMTREKNNTEKRLKETKKKIEELNVENEILHKSNSKNNEKLVLMGDKKFELEEIIREKEKEISKLKLTNDLRIRTTGKEDLQKIRVLQDEIKTLRQEERGGNYEPVEPGLKNKIKAIFKRYGFTFAAVFSSVGVVVGIIISSISPGLVKTNRILSNGLKNIEDKLKQLGKSPSNKPGILRMITEFIFKTAGEVFGYLGDHTWLLIFLVVILYISN